MRTDSNPLSKLIQGGVEDVLSGEELVKDAFKDLLRDEVKLKMSEVLEANPEIKQELKDAVGLYLEAKVNEAYATLKFMKASAKLGVELMPDHLREALGREVAKILEKDVPRILEKTL